MIAGAWLVGAASVIGLSAAPARAGFFEGVASGFVLSNPTPEMSLEILNFYDDQRCGFSLGASILPLGQTELTRFTFAQTGGGVVGSLRIDIHTVVTADLKFQPNGLLSSANIIDIGTSVAFPLFEPVHYELDPNAPPMYKAEQQLLAATHAGTTVGPAQIDGFNLGQARVPAVGNTTVTKGRDAGHGKNPTVLPPDILMTGTPIITDAAGVSLIPDDSYSVQFSGLGPLTTTGLLPGEITDLIPCPNGDDRCGTIDRTRSYEIALTGPAPVIDVGFTTTTRMKTACVDCPEPAALALLITGCTGLVPFRWRRRARMNRGKPAFPHW